MSVPLYDVTAALRQLNRYRQQDTRLARTTALLGDDLAEHLRRHFPAPMDQETAGRAIVLVIASLLNLTDGPSECDQWARAVLNTGALAGQRLMVGNPGGGA